MIPSPGPKKLVPLVKPEVRPPTRPVPSETPEVKTGPAPLTPPHKPGSLQPSAVSPPALAPRVNASAPASLSTEEPGPAPVRKQESPAPQPAAQVPPRWLAFKFKARHRSVPFLFVIAIAVLGILATLMVIRPGSGDLGPMVSPSGQPRLAVLGIVNDTDDREHDTWGRALGQALITDLSQASSFEVVPGDQLHSALKGLGMLESVRKELSTADLQKVARRTGAFYLGSGQLSRANGRLVIQMDLKEASKGRSLISRSFEVAESQGLLDLVDDITHLLKEGMAQAEVVVDTSGADRVFQEYTTASPEAYRSYAAGQWHQWNQDYRDSITAFEQAIELDPEFAAAYVDAAESYTALGYLYQGWKKCQAAQRLVDRLSEQERMHLQGEFYRRSEKTYDIALKVYSRLIELYPDDSRASANLGVLHSRMGEWDLARQRFGAGLQNPATSRNLILGMAQVDALQQDFESAIETLRSSSRDSFDSQETRFQLAWIFLLKGDYESALEEVKRGQKLGSAYTLTRMQGEIFLMQGELQAAEAVFNQLLQDPEPIAQLWGRKRLADVALLGGQFAKALENLTQGLRLAADSKEMSWKYRLHLDTARVYLETGKATRAMQQCDAAWSIAVQGETMDLPRDALHYRGLCYLALNRMRDAQRTAERLKGLCEKGPVKDRMRYYYHLMGKIEMARNNPGQAVEHFVQAVGLLPPQGAPWHFSNDHALFIDALAEAYYAADNPIKALEEFENARDLSSGRLLYGDLYAKIYYKLGKIREEYGLYDIASSGYQRFLDLWQNADPKLPEKRDAEKRLAAAKGR